MRKPSSLQRTKESRSTPAQQPDATRPGSLHRWTVVRRNPPRMPGAVVGVASERNVLVLESDANVDELLSALDEHHVTAKQLHVSTARATPRWSFRATRPRRRESADDLSHRFGKRLVFVSGSARSARSAPGLTLRIRMCARVSRLCEKPAPHLRASRRRPFASPGWCPTRASTPRSARFTRGSSNP